MEKSKFSRVLQVVGGLVGLIFGVMAISRGCQTFFGEDYGVKLTFNGGELYRTSSVSDSEATSLGRYLVKTGYFEGTPKTVQLDRPEKNLIVRFVLRPEYVRDSGNVVLLEIMLLGISQDVFHGAPITGQMCDSLLHPVTTVVPAHIVRRSKVNGGEIFGSPSVSDSEIVAVGKYLNEQGFFDGTDKVLVLDKPSGAYVLSIVMNSEYASHPERIDSTITSSFQFLCEQMSHKLFNGSPVTIHLCGAAFKTMKVIEM